MNLSLEFATLVRRSPENGRCPVWIANGPVACELDLWALSSPSPARAAGEERPLCDLLLRKLAHLLAAGEPPIAFVPRIEAGDTPWQVGIRFERVEAVEASPPSARVDTVGGERVQVGDPAFRVVIVGDGNSVTLRSDWAGIKGFEAHCREASLQLRRRAARDGEYGREP